MNAMAVYIVRPMYLEKWLIDLMKTYKLKKNDVLVVQGSNQLKALLRLASTNKLKAKMILLSNKTVQNWLKLYEEFKEGTIELGYDCLPHQLFSHLKAGFRVIDEVHQDFHLNFKIDLYTHVKDSVSLSATLVSDDPFISKMYEIAYPLGLRYKAPTYKKYIRARAVLWGLSRPDLIRTQDFGSKTYSHHAFERSIMSKPQCMEKYLKLIQNVIQNTYIKNYQPGDRLIVFCASIAMCTKVTAFLAECYRELDVKRYVEDDPYDNLMKPDIRVSTLQSAGTAVDIPNLATTVMTTAVSSSQANIQGLGRLREMKDGRVPEFVYFACVDIKKHMEYHEKKREMLKDRTLEYHIEHMGIKV